MATSNGCSLGEQRRQGPRDTIGWLSSHGHLTYFSTIMEITGYTWEKSCGSFRFMMESWIFKSNIEWKLLVWNVVLPMERFIHIHLDLADYKVIKTNDKHALLKPSVPIHSTRRPVKRNKQTKFWDSPLIFYSEHGNISKKFRDSVFHWIYSSLKC